MSKPYDATSKFLIELHPEDWLRFLNLEATSVEIVDADLSTVTASADKIFKIINEGEVYGLHVDIQSAYDANLDDRVHGYNVLAKMKLAMMIISVVFLLHPRAAARGASGSIVWNHPLTRHHFSYTLIKVWEQDVEGFLNCGLSLLPFAPLANLGATQLPDVIRRMEKIISQEADAGTAAQLWTASKIMMGLKFDSVMIDRLLRGVMGMKESVTYQAILEEGREEGEIKGMVKGVKAAIFRIGRRRYGEPSFEVQEKIEAIKDLETLTTLSDRLDLADTWLELLGAS